MKKKRTRIRTREQEKNPASRWTPHAISCLVLVVTGCTCLVVFEVRVFHLMEIKIIGPAWFEIISGSGLLGIGGWIFRLLRIAINAGGRHNSGPDAR